MFFFLYSRGPTVSTLPYTLSPYTKLYRSDRHQPAAQRDDIGQHALIGAQLDVAVGAPAAAVEGDDHRAAAQQAGQGYRAAPGVGQGEIGGSRSEERTSEIQSLMRISYAVLCLKTKNKW